MLKYIPLLCKHPSIFKRSELNTQEWQQSVVPLKEVLNVMFKLLNVNPHLQGFRT